MLYGNKYLFKRLFFQRNIFLKLLIKIATKTNAVFSQSKNKILYHFLKNCSFKNNRNKFFSLSLSYYSSQNTLHVLKLNILTIFIVYDGWIVRFIRYKLFKTKLNDRFPIICTGRDECESEIEKRCTNLIRML